MSKAPEGFGVQRWTSSQRLSDIMALVHSAFAGLTPPSGVLRETITDLERRQRDGFVLVAMDGDDFVGTVFCAGKDGALYLTRMAVRPDLQRRGIGRALVAAAEREARSLGLRKLSLRVRQSLPANKAYFERQGFAVTGEGRDPGRPPYDAMERRL